MTLQADDAIRHIAEAASAFGAGIVDRTSLVLILDVPIPRLDGKPVTYQIEVVPNGTSVSAKELVSNRLPTCCPNLHINPDATFCLSLKSEDPLSVVDEKSAGVWWETLIQFLRLQERAVRLRRWPDEKEWAHGDAARYQKQGQQAAMLLGADFMLALRERRLRVITVPARRQPAGETLRLTLDGRHLISVLSSSMTVMNRRQACPCQHEGRRVYLRRCEQHAHAIAALAGALLGWQRAEAAFWARLRERDCCGRVERCELRGDG